MFTLEEPSTFRLIKALEMNDRAVAFSQRQDSEDRASSHRGIAWVQDGSGIRLLFPRLRGSEADHEIGHFLRDIRRIRPRVPVHASIGPGCTPVDIVARLVAFGFEIPQGGGLAGMVTSLARIPRQDVPRGVVIRQTSGSERTCRLEAYKGRVSVGRAFVQCAAGVAGIYDLMVEEQYRDRGIGSLLMEAACRWSRTRGIRAAVLTANPLAESLYARFGFREISRIRHCSLSKAALAARPLTSLQRKVVVAVYMGRLEKLKSIACSGHRKLVTPSGATLIQVAAATRQVKIGEWLLERGEVADPLSAWDLGWGDRLSEIVLRHPKSINQKSGGLTPLHHAVLRRDTKVDSDLSLLSALLEAGADPGIEDDTHRSTPLGWTRAFRDTEAAALLSESRPDS